MENKFSDHNEFDKYVREEDKWIYDNGWSYEGELFSAYMLERFDRVESGKLVEYLVMLRDDKNSNKTIILHGKDIQFDEIWSGFVNSKDDYQVMMSVVSKFIEEYKNNLGAL
ncbi:MAG TPA: hypothetical protein VFR47_25135 [Anaerolineales bacterium]|nr:hypothetical protein [Anaerolineales bacterium]